MIKQLHQVSLNSLVSYDTKNFRIRNFGQNTRSQNEDKNFARTILEIYMYLHFV